jgi:hypothetical protein
MSNVKIYVENEEGIYEPLDLFDDENIEMNFKLKDSSDLAKVFSTYSQTFKIPDSQTNRRLTNYYFNTEVERESNKYLKTKIEVNLQIFKVGFISVNEGVFMSNRGSSIGINFFTSLSNLKELYGDETLSQTLESIVYDVEWTDGRVYLYSQGLVSNPAFDPKLIVPLVSNKRVWSYNNNLANDIKYTGSNVSGKAIETNELRPAIPFSKIMDGIAQSRGINFTSPLFGTDEYEKLYVWCNGVQSSKVNYEIKMTGNFTGSNSSPWTVVKNSNGYTIDITYNGNYTTTNTSTIFFELYPLKKFTNDIDVEIKVKWYNDTTNELLKEQMMGVFSNNLYSSLLNLNALDMGINNTTPFKIRVEIETNQFIYWDTGKFIFRALGADLSINTTVDNENISPYLILPSIKTIDFLSSFIKMFNISIIEDDYDPTLVNFIPRNELYTKTEDYTSYIDIETHTVKSTNLYKSINFKHKTAKYKSNIDFKNGINKREYGELIYSSSDAQLKDEYKIETQFAIVPNRLIVNTNVQTFYGFTDSSETSTTYGTLYKPNTDDLTIFYYNGSQQLKSSTGANISFNFKITENGATIIEDLLTYNKVSVVYDDNPLTYTNSLVFQVEVDAQDSQFEFEKNLFSNYYQNDITKLYNPNSRLFVYNCFLPKNIINDFSLGNILKIGDRKFTIEEAVINIVTGKSKITLMNIAPKIVSVLTPPNPPTTFTATLI